MRMTPAPSHAKRPRIVALSSSKYRVIVGILNDFDTDVAARRRIQQDRKRLPCTGASSRNIAMEHVLRWCLASLIVVHCVKSLPVGSKTLQNRNEPAQPRSLNSCLDSVRRTPAADCVQ